MTERVNYYSQNPDNETDKPRTNESDTNWPPVIVPGTEGDYNTIPAKPRPEHQSGSDWTQIRPPASPEPYIPPKQ
jgi:hypothetical protein